MCALLTGNHSAWRAETEERADYPRRIILGLMLSIVGVLLRSLFNRALKARKYWKNTVLASMPASPVGMAESA